MNINSEPKESILFIDDEKSILDVVSEYFLTKGYVVFTANNGLEGIEIITNHKIDCCFTDINMPVMNGIEFAEKLRSIDNTIPIIIITAYPSFNTTLQTLKNGVVDFLVKPAKLTQMEICLTRVLRERKLFIKNILLNKEVKHGKKLKRINAELFNKIEEIETLNKIMSDVAEIRASDDVYQKLVSLSSEITHADNASFYIYSEVLKKPKKIAYFSLQKQDSPLNSSSDKNLNVKDNLITIIHKIFSTQTPVISPNNDDKIVHGSDINYFMAVPLKIVNKIFGVLTVSSSNNIFSKQKLYYLSFIAEKASYVIENMALYEHINQGIITTLKAFVKAIEVRDPYTKEHSNRVTQIAVLLGTALNCSEEEIDILRIAGPLHDIGKIGIRDQILLKKGSLTSKEFAKIKEHPDIGADIIAQLIVWDEHQLIIRHHHERYDGSGYPGKLNKKNIPFLARILSVADAHDAMASDRAYRKSLEKDKIIKIITNCSGSQFDPQVVTAYLELCRINKIVF